MHLETTIDIEAPASVAWAVLADIPHWPDWTSSVEAVEAADVRPLQPGSSAALNLRGAPQSTDWIVTDARPGESFTWQTKALGLKSVAGHTIEPRPGGCRVKLSVEHHGPAALVLRPFLKRVTVRNLAAEAAGLKRRSEELSFAA